MLVHDTGRLHAEVTELGDIATRHGIAVPTEVTERLAFAVELAAHPDPDGPDLVARFAAAEALTGQARAEALTALRRDIRDAQVQHANRATEMQAFQGEAARQIKMARRALLCTEVAEAFRVVFDDAGEAYTEAFRELHRLAPTTWDDRDALVANLAAVEVHIRATTAADVLDELARVRDAYGRPGGTAALVRLVDCGGDYSVARAAFPSNFLGTGQIMPGGGLGGWSRIVLAGARIQWADAVQAQAEGERIDVDESKFRPAGGGPVRVQALAVAR